MLLVNVPWKLSGCRVWASGALALRGEQSGLALEARNPVGVLRHRFEKHLDGHLAIELVISRSIHLAHSPHTEGSEDLVASETITGRKCHACFQCSHHSAGSNLPIGRPTLQNR